MTSARAPEAQLSTTRLLALADGIFAIAMTLLVFEIHVPGGLASTVELKAKLAQLWPKFASCGLSFLTLGFSWVGHHNQYVAIQRTNRVFLWINIAFLSAIALVPFSSALLGEYPFERIAVQIYAGNLAVAGALLYLHWTYATSRAQLADARVSKELIRSTARRVLIAPVSYCAVILLAELNVMAALVVCLGIPLYFMVPGRVDRHWD